MGVTRVCYCLFPPSLNTGEYFLPRSKSSQYKVCGLLKTKHDPVTRMWCIKYNGRHAVLLLIRLLEIMTMVNPMVCYSGAYEHWTVIKHGGVSTVKNFFWSMHNLVSQYSTSNKPSSKRCQEKKERAYSNLVIYWAERYYWKWISSPSFLPKRLILVS